MSDAPASGLREATSGFGVQFFEHAVENRQNTLLFVPADGIDELVEANGLQRGDEEFPRDGDDIQRHVDEHGPYLTVTSRFRTTWLGVVPRTTERAYTYDLTILQDAADYLDAGRDPFRQASYWIPTDEPFPMVAELPHSPPALVSLVEHGDLRHLDEVENEAFQRSCGCVIPPVMEA